MAEEGSLCELEELETQLQNLLNYYASDDLRGDSKAFCSDFCTVVEEFASQWHVPLPQLRILETALCYFARASTSFSANCDHVLHTLSSLALSVFESLLFFDQTDFHKEPLEHFTLTFQECHSVLTRHQNVHLLQVERSVQGGGPWASSVLQEILNESTLPQDQVDGYISSELPVFFELRVRYLLSRERFGEAMALAQCCAWHPKVGQHSFFLQVYLTRLFKTSQQERLNKEVNNLCGKDAVHIICSLECEEQDDLLLGLCRTFLSQQLRRGDMYYLCDLVFIWSKLHSRLKTSKQTLLDESRQLMLCATNVNSIFPFIRAILQELGEDGKQFCVELCANALESCLPCDVLTKTLIYKTIAGLLPNDLEVCRACALLVFFLERTVMAYKMVYLLYMHPDQEYPVEHSPIEINVRFEMLQVLKKGLYFDPEFWNLITLRTNCLKLMSEKVVSSALDEIMEDKWILNYCTKEPATRSNTCLKGRTKSSQAAAKKRHQTEETVKESKRLKAGPGKTRLTVEHAEKKRSAQGLRPRKDASSQPSRRSYWRLERLQDNVGIRYGEHRRITRHAAKNLPKRRIRKPRWLLEDSGTLQKSNMPSKIKKHELRQQKPPHSSVLTRSETGHTKNNAEHKVNSHFKDSEINMHKGGLPLDCDKPEPTPQVVLELSLPDNELMGIFSDDSCHRLRGFPQVLLYKPTVKLADTSQPVKTVHRNEVVLRARDVAMFVQQLHCYARRQKGKGNGLSVHGSVSTITRSSVQGSPPNDAQRERRESARRSSAASQDKVHLLSRRTRESADTPRTPAGAKVRKSSVSKKISLNVSKGKMLRSLSSAQGKSVDKKKAMAESPTSEASDKRETPVKEVCEEPTVEMKVTIASQTSVAAKAQQLPGLNKISTSAETPQMTVNPVVVRDESPPVTDAANNGNHTDSTLSSCSNSVFIDEEKEHSSPPELPNNAGTAKDTIHRADTATLSEVSKPSSPPNQNAMNDITALTLATEMATELAPEALDQDLDASILPTSENRIFKDTATEIKTKVPHINIHSTSSCSAPAPDASAVADVQAQKGKTQDIDSDGNESSEPETEESKLEFCCIFCQKDFKGRHVVAHAMFHYRKDECMFCGTIFKDDLLAMMHLSDHIEKLKRLKDRENRLLETNGISPLESSAKGKTAIPSTARQGKWRKSAVPLASGYLQDSSTLDSTKPMLGDTVVEGKHLQHWKQNTSKQPYSDVPVHKRNGYVGKKKEIDHIRKKEEEKSNDGSAKLSEPKDEQRNLDSPPVVNETAKEKDAEPQTLCCPIDDCVWSTDKSKSRVALLYHALEDHHGEEKPLKLAFQVGNNKCLICMRVLGSYEHFQHHVARHRVAPRHPCLHQGCTSRFKSGIEMRRHARRHSPLQAVCCVPGCSQLFICLWALNLHERDHYASKHPKPDKIKDKNMRDGHKNLAREAEVTGVSFNVSRKYRRRAMRNSSLRQHIKAPPVFNAGEPKNDPSVLKHVSNDSAQPRHTLRKMHETNTTVVSPDPPKCISSSLLKHKTKGKHKFKKNHMKIAEGPRRRGRPPKAKYASRICQKSKKNKEKDSAEVADVSERKKEDADTKTSSGEVKKSSHKQMKRGHQKEDLDNPTAAVTASNSLTPSISTGSAETKQRLTIEKIRKCLSPLTKCRQSVTLDSSESNVNAMTIEKKCPLQESELTKMPDAGQQVETKPVEKSSSVEDGQTRSENRSESTGVATDILNKGACPSTSEDTRIEKHEEMEKTSVDQDMVKQKKKHLNKQAVDEKHQKDPNKKSAKTKSVVGRDNGSQAAMSENSASHKDVKVKEDVPDAKTSNLTEKTLPTAQVRKEKKFKKTSDPNEDHKKRKKIHKEINTKVIKKSKCDGISPARKCKSEVQPLTENKVKADESSVGEEGKTSVEVPPISSPCSSNPVETSGTNELNLPTASEETKHNVTKEKKVKKSSNSDKEKTKKRKWVKKDGDMKIVKKSKANVFPKTSQCDGQMFTEIRATVEESTVGDEGKTSVETPTSTIVNGEPEQNVKVSVCKETLALYSKKPYLRLPPTAYLDERYTNMPKRRKDRLLFELPPKVAPPGQAAVSAAQQRQRCANCFATFESAEDLQGHLQLKRCSSLFGFDSDDEGF